jgi:hypothetical protein
VDEVKLPHEMELCRTEPKDSPFSPVFTCYPANGPTPTQGANHGHIGIVGATTGGVNDTLVYSNSSGAKRFAQNFTIGTFTNYFVKHHLQVLFFALKPDQF